MWLAAFRFPPRNLQRPSALIPGVSRHCAGWPRPSRRGDRYLQKPLASDQLATSSDGLLSTHWSQYELRLPAKPRGLHLITDEVVSAVQSMGEVDIGLLHIFVLHTSASLTINENADPDVRVDLADALDRIAPESAPYRHTCEGPDDMPAHIKSSLTGASMLVPVRSGRLALGTWQGIYLCEHREHATPRRLMLTLQGQT